MSEVAADIVVDEIPNVEMESLDYLDEGMEESIAKDGITGKAEPKADKEEDAVIDIEADDDTEDEKITEVEDTKESEEKEAEPKTVNISDLRVKERSNKEYKEAAGTLEALSEDFQDLEQDEAPIKPTKDQYGDVDEEVMSEYRTELALWKRETVGNKRKAERIQDKMRKAATKAQNAFLKDFPEARTNGFENFVASKQLRYLSWTTGERSLYSLYREHLEGLEILDDAKVVKKLKKEGVKIKPTSHKEGSAAKTKGTNGFSSAYKYANMPMFKDFVKEKRGTVSDFTHRKMTDKEVDELCKQEYRLSKGLDLV